MNQKLNWTNFGVGVAVWFCFGVIISAFIAMISAAVHGRFGDDPTETDAVTGVVVYAVTSMVMALAKIRHAETKHGNA